MAMAMAEGTSDVSSDAAVLWRLKRVTGVPCAVLHHVTGVPCDLLTC